MSNDFMLHSLASETVKSLSDFKLDSMRGTANESSQISLGAKVLKVNRQETMAALTGVYMSVELYTRHLCMH